MNRRDKCHIVGKRAAGLLTEAEKATAWDTLVAQLGELGELPMPKFKHLLRAIRVATIAAKAPKNTDEKLS